MIFLDRPSLTLYVECDHCANSEEYSYDDDMAQIITEIKRSGWRIAHDLTYGRKYLCPECAGN